MAPKYIDPAAEERRLHPIYDAIDSRNYKQAIKLADQLLKKQPGSHMVRVLKAVSLDRIGRRSEAIALADTVRKEVPESEHVMQTLALVYKAAGCLTEMQEMYEAALQNNPTNVELMRNLFLSLVRAADFTKQQQMAMKLYKVTKDEQYIYWSATSNVLQALSQDDPEQRAKLLSLSEAIVKRQLNANPQQAKEECILLMLDIFERQSRPWAALELLQGPLGEQLSIPSERSRIKANLHLKLGEHAEAIAEFRSILQNNPDDWGATMGAFDAMLPASAQSSPDESQEWNEADLELGLQRAQALVRNLQEWQAAEPSLKRIRGPQLSLVELAMRRLTMGGKGLDVSRCPLEYPGQSARSPAAGEGPAWDLAAALMVYCQAHGHTTSLAADTRRYARTVVEASAEASAWLEGELRAQATAQGNVLDVNAVRRQVAARCLLFTMAEQHRNIPRDAGNIEDAQAVVAQAQEHARVLMELYEAALPLYEGADPRERGPADELPLLAARTLMVAHQQADPRYARLPVQALAFLEAGYKHSPHNAQLRLAICSLYGVLGATEAASNVFAALDVKHIQLDTLPHHILPTLQGGFYWERARQLCEEVLMMHKMHNRDAADSMQLAYDQGTYSKVLEFVAFKQRLHESHMRAAALCEVQLQRIREVYQHASNSADIEAILEACCNEIPEERFTDAVLEKMRFNEDLATQPTWQAAAPNAWFSGIYDWWHALEGSPDMLPHCVEGVRQLPDELASSWRVALKAQALKAHTLRSLMHGLGDPTVENVAGMLERSTRLVGALGSSQSDWAADVRVFVAAALQATDEPTTMSITDANNALVAGIFKVSCEIASLCGSNEPLGSCKATCVLLGDLSQLVPILCTRIRNRLQWGVCLTTRESGSNELLPLARGGLASAAMLLGDGIMWTAVCLQMLAAGCVAKRKSKKKSAKQVPVEVEVELRALISACGSALELFTDIVEPLLSTSADVLVSHMSACLRGEAPCAIQESKCVWYGADTSAATDVVVQKIVASHQGSFKRMKEMLQRHIKVFRMIQL